MLEIPIVGNCAVFRQVKKILQLIDVGKAKTVVPSLVAAP